MPAHLPSRWLPSLALLVVLSSPAHAEAPGPDALLRLDDRLVRARNVRVTLSAGYAITTQTARADVQGLSFEGARAYSSRTSGATPSDPDRVGWNDITRIDVSVNHGLRTGLITGLVLTGLCAAALVPAAVQGEEIGMGGLIILAIPLGVATGTLIGAAHPGWQRVHPAR